MIEQFYMIHKWFDQSSSEQIHASRFFRMILACTYTICHYGRILVYSELPFLPSHVYFFLISFCINLLHSLMWLTVSSASSHNLHLPEWQCPLFGMIAIYFFYSLCYLLLGLVVWLRLADPFVSQNPREFYASHFSRRILSCAYSICLSGQI